MRAWFRRNRFAFPLLVMLAGLLLVLALQTDAQYVCNYPDSCWFMTQNAMASATIQAQQTSVAGTPSATPAPTNTVPPLGFFPTYAATSTPGFNLNCPSTPFDTVGLDPGWAYVCRSCVDAVKPTPTKFVNTPLVPESTIDTTDIAFAPIDVSWLSGTPTSGTPSATPSATLTPTVTPTPSELTYVYDFTASNHGWSILSNNTPTWGFYTAGQGWESNDTTGAGGPVDALYVGSPSFVSQATITGFAVWWSGGGSDQFTLSLDAGVWSSTQASHTYTSSNSGDNGVRFSGTVGNVGMLTITLEGARVPDLVISKVQVWYSAGSISTTVTPTPSPTTAATSTGTVTAVPTVNMQNMTLPPGVNSMDCTNPRYTDPEFQPAKAEIDASGFYGCLLVVPRIWIGFSTANSVLTALAGHDVTIPDFHVPSVQVCFAGVHVALTIWGFELDIAALVGLALIAWMIRVAIRL